MRTSPLTVLLLTLALVLAACSGGDGAAEDVPTDGAGADGSGVDGAALAASYTAAVDAAVTAQVEAGVAPNPLGRVLDDCLVVDTEAMRRIGEALGVADTEPELLNVVVQDPEGVPTLQCAIRYGESSAGAVVLSTTTAFADAESARADLTAQGFSEVDEATADGLPDDEVLLFDSTSFDASRVVWVADGFQVSLTVNADIADTGALLDALPVTVQEVARGLGAQ